MIELNKLVNECMANIEKENYVEKVIEKNLKSTLDSIISDCLSSYSAFGKNLKKEVETNININLKELDMPRYNVLVLNAVKEKLDAAIKIQGIDKIKESMDKMLSDTKTEYTISEILEEIKTREREYKDDGDKITLIIEEPQYGTIRIYIDKDEDTKKYSCEYQLAIHEKEGTIWNAKLDDRDLTKNKEFGCLFGVESLFFKIYATGAKVIFDKDEDDYDLYYHNDED